MVGRIHLLLVILVSCQLLDFCANDKNEKKLYSDLLQNYSKLERPVADNALPVNVSLQIILQQIVDVVL